MALGFPSVVELQQHGVKYLEDEIVERHCMEAVQLLVLLWIVHCFEKTEAGQWLQHCPIFYAELFGNSNPRQIIQNLYKTDLNNVCFFLLNFIIIDSYNLQCFDQIQMILLTDTLRIRVELLDCSCGDLDAEQSKLPQLFLDLSIRHSQEFFYDLENVFLQNFSNHHVEIIRKVFLFFLNFIFVRLFSNSISLDFEVLEILQKFPNNKDESDRSIEGNEGARNHSCRSVICVVMYLGEIITTLLC
ncbi:unnamed protein product [Brugia pahangi]|uniref:Uncharacterized protein n=1 Tax=Brugia pahangi TaxID=6280 RepID=A0A0N4T4G1_BRUPA|nr:unnamed protein product [Brugia pahangi]